MSQRRYETRTSHLPRRSASEDVVKGVTGRGRHARRGGRGPRRQCVVTNTKRRSSKVVVEGAHYKVTSLRGHSVEGHSSRETIEPPI